MTRRAAKPKPRQDAMAREVAAMRAELSRTRGELVALGLIVAGLRRDLHDALRPMLEPVDNDPPVGVVSAAEISGKSRKWLCLRIDKGESFGWIDGATEHYVVRLRALRDYLVRHGEPLTDALKDV
jgi:hypothetical protein